MTEYPCKKCQACGNYIEDKCISTFLEYTNEYTNEIDCQNWMKDSYLKCKYCGHYYKSNGKCLKTGFCDITGKHYLPDQICVKIAETKKHFYITTLD